MIFFLMCTSVHVHVYKTCARVMALSACTAAVCSSSPALPRKEKSSQKQMNNRKDATCVFRRRCARRYVTQSTQLNFKESRAKKRL